jgi:4-diphosphocytidyl-2C-methyl-D-erythritol kinase
MSGSGSTIVGAFRNAEDRDAAREHFKNIRAVAAETT